MQVSYVLFKKMLFSRKKRQVIKKCWHTCWLLFGIITTLYTAVSSDIHFTITNNRTKNPSYGVCWDCGQVSGREQSLNMYSCDKIYEVIYDSTNMIGFEAI